MRDLTGILTILIALLLGVMGGSQIVAQTPRVLPLGAGRPDTPGVIRTPLKDDEKALVVRVQFEPGAKEPPHTHPYDVMLIPLANRAVEFNMGGQSMPALKVGTLHLIPRNVTHYLVNPGNDKLDFITIALK